MDINLEIIKLKQKHVPRTPQLDQTGGGIPGALVCTGHGGIFPAWPCQTMRLIYENSKIAAELMGAEARIDEALYACNHAATNPSNTIESIREALSRKVTKGE